MRAGLPGSFPESLRLDGPDDQAGASQRRIGRGAYGHLELLRKSGLLFGKRLDHLNLAGGHTAFEQPANDGAGHVAATYEGDVFNVAVWGFGVHGPGV